MNLADEVEVQKRRKVTFTGKQLLAIDGNRFYNEDMTEAINLARAFIAWLIPVFCLDAEVLFPVVKSLISLVHDAGGRVFSIMSDNLSVNQKTFRMFHEAFQSLGISSVVHPFPNSKFEVLFTLYDPTTHLFKNIRNNWMTEEMQKLKFRQPETNGMFTAKWKDFVKIYKAELESNLKQTKLDYSTLHPNNFKKQKVRLVFNVFNEKIVVVLDGKEGMEGTHRFEIYIKFYTREKYFLLFLIFEIFGGFTP